MHTNHPPSPILLEHNSFASGESIFFFIIIIIIIIIISGVDWVLIRGGCRVWKKYRLCCVH